MPWTATVTLLSQTFGLNRSEPDVDVLLGEDDLLIVGAGPDADAIDAPEFRRLRAGRALHTLPVTTGEGRELSRNHLLLWVETGLLRAARLHDNRVEIQPFGSIVRYGSIASLPGETLPAAATIWLPRTHLGGRTPRRLAVVNRAAHRTRASWRRSGSGPTVDESPPPPLTPTRIDALAARYRDLLVFPADNPLPSLQPLSGSEEEARRDTNDFLHRVTGTDLRTTDRDLLGRLFDSAQLFLEDLFERYQTTGAEELADAAALYRALIDA